MLPCPRCGEEIEPEAEFCPHCGEAVEPLPTGTQPQPPEKELKTKGEVERRDRRRVSLRAVGLLLAGLLAGVVVFSAMAYAGAVPGLTPSATLQVGFQDLSVKIGTLAGGLDSLSQALAIHETNLETLGESVSTSVASIQTTLTDTLGEVSDDVVALLSQFEGFETGLSQVNATVVTVQSQISSLSSDIDSVRVDVAETLNRIGEPSSTVFGVLGDLQSAVVDLSTNIDAMMTQLNTALSGIADLQTDVGTIGEGLDVGGSFYNFVNSWFIAITDALNGIMDEMNTIEAKLDDIIIPLLGQGLPGEFQGFLVSCPPGPTASPCDSFLPLNTLGLPALPHPKKASLWIRPFALEPGDVFVARAEPLYADGSACVEGDLMYGTMLDSVTIDSTSTDWMLLAYDQLPVPCGVYFTMERTGSAGGDTDTMRLVVVMEEV